MLDSSFLQNFKVVKMLLLLNSKRHSPNNVMLLTREALLFRPVSLRIPSFSVPNKHQETINIEKGILTRINRNLRKKKELHPLFPFSIRHLWTGRSLFYQGLSHTLGIHKTAGKGRVPSFIPLYHFHQLTNIHTFICNFTCEMTTSYFWSDRI